MAKQSIVQVIKAKPGGRVPNRGKTSHLPLICSTHKCSNEALTITGPYEKRIYKCAACYANPPQVGRQTKLRKQLQSLGLVF